MQLGYLQIHQNPNAPRRADGRRYWGHPSRRGGRIDLIGVHTAEIAIDVVGPDAGAERIRDYFTTSDRPASYHVIADSDSTVMLLPPEATAFGIVGYNARTWHLSFACRTIDWGKDTDWDDAALHRAAKAAAVVAVEHNVPIRWISKQAADEGQRGFVEHGTMDPGRRSDPGQMFQRHHFLALVSHYAGQAGTPTQEDDMAQIYNVQGDLYLVGGVHAAHIAKGPTVQALKESGVKEVEWKGTADDFVDAFILGDTDTGAMPRKATTKRVAKAKS